MFAGCRPYGFLHSTDCELVTYAQEAELDATQATATYTLRILCAICEIYASEKEKFFQQASAYKMRTVETWAHMWNTRELLESASQQPSFQVNVLPAMVQLLHQTVELHVKR